MKNKKAVIITGITGQDGSYLAEFLLSKGYEVHGLMRRISGNNLGRIEHLLDGSNLFNREKTLLLHYGDLSDSGSINRLIKKVGASEIYHLGAQSHVGLSFEIPEYTSDITGLSTLKILEAIRLLNPSIKFYQASTSELFGKVLETPQTEKTPFNPRSPYGIAKLFAYQTAVNYRQSYNIFACNGILFNHESPRRGEDFVTRKITLGIAKIKAGLQKKITLGNLDAKRDWGYAPEYIEAMWLMLQQDGPDDYVVATGETHSIKEFVEEAFKCAGIKNWQEYIETDKTFKRPAEVDILRGDSSKAKKMLGWQPKVKFKELVKIMVDADINLVNKKFGKN